VDINTIRAWLGYASLATTNVYAEVDLEMNATALETCEIKGEQGRKAWRQNADLMEFLRNLSQGDSSTVQSDDPRPQKEPAVPMIPEN